MPLCSERNKNSGYNIVCIFHTEKCLIRIYYELKFSDVSQQQECIVQTPTRAERIIDRPKRNVYILPTWLPAHPMLPLIPLQAV